MCISIPFTTTVHIPLSPYGVVTRKISDKYLFYGFLCFQLFTWIVGMQISFSICLFLLVEVWAYSGENFNVRQDKHCAFISDIFSSSSCLRFSGIAFRRLFVRSLSFFLCQRQDMQMHARLNNKGKGFNFLLLYFWYGKKKNEICMQQKKTKMRVNRIRRLVSCELKVTTEKKTLVLKNLLICQRLFLSIFSRWFFTFDSVWRTVQIEIK